MNACGYGMRCGSLGSEGILLRVQAGRNVVFEVLENQFLKALHQDGVESHKAAVVKTKHSRISRYRNDL